MHVFSMNSILDYVDHLRDGGAGLANGERAGLLMMRVDADDIPCFVHAGDTLETGLVVVDEHAMDEFSEHPRLLERLLQRVHRVAREFANPPVSLPGSWRKFQADNRVAFFALPRSLNPRSVRWIAENVSSGPVVFWEITAAGGEKELGAYRADYSRVGRAKAAWEIAVSGAAGLGEGGGREAKLRRTVDLEVVGSAAISRRRPYGQWLKLIDEHQEKVLAYDAAQTLKIRGIAGTGKTLTLQLKALKELYAAVDRAEEMRILYLTHSWALADMVDDTIQAIDERGLGSQIEVWPLAMAREYLHGQIPEGVEIIGEDGLEGRKLQISLVSAILDDLVLTDWPTYRDRYDVSDFVRAGVERRSEAERLSLCWMLIREFAEVMDAHQIKPSRNALKKYLEIKRADWMVQLDTDGDKRTFYAVFQRFVARLVEEGQMTTDQAFDDFRRYLESYAWNIRRTTEGFDLILVDEFHLFSDSERYLLNFLTKDATSPPRMILALDPKQSPFMLLTGLSDNPLSRRAAGVEADVGYVDLGVVHRFSPEILRVVQMIQRTHPAILDEGDDWRFTVENLVGRRKAGGVPRLSVVAAEDDAVVEAVACARSMHRKATGDERVALIAAGTLEFDALLAGSPGDGSPDFTVLNSRDEVDQLNYAKKSIVLAAGADCAGLQFTHVVVLIFSSRESTHGRGTSATRAAITDLYLAVSRAEQALEIVSTRGEGTIPELLAQGIEDGILDVVEDDGQHRTSP